MSFTNYYFELGYNTALEKQAGRKASAAAGALPIPPLNYILAGLASEQGTDVPDKALRTGLGSYAGSAIGGALGLTAGGLAGLLADSETGSLALPGLLAGGLAGSSLGGGLGAYFAHGPNKED